MVIHATIIMFCMTAAIWSFLVGLKQCMIGIGTGLVHPVVKAMIAFIGGAAWAAAAVRLGMLWLS